MKNKLRTEDTEDIPPFGGVSTKGWIVFRD